MNSTCEEKFLSIGTRKKRKAPILDYPSDEPGLIEPFEIYANKPRLPPRCVLCFFAEIIKKYKENNKLELVTELRGEGEPTPVYQYGQGDGAITVVVPGMGAPFACSILEELIAMGVRAVICVGGAGVLDGSIPVGQVMIPTTALRDEGTSYHYQKRGRMSRPHPLAVKAIKEACREREIPFTVVRTWTTDGVFRETKTIIEKRKAEGCLAVEMEASAFFAVSKFRKIVCGQILYAGDDVSGSKWKHRSWNRLTDRREELFQLGLESCRILKV